MAILTQNYPVTCEKCGTTQNFAARVTLNPQLRSMDKDDLMSGRLNRFTCCKCGLEKSYDFPLIYTDTDKRLMVWLSPVPPPLEEKSPFEGFSEEFDLRLVSNRNELIEKVLIWDDDLDDRVVEYVKRLVRVHALKTSQPLDGDLMFTGVLDNEDGKKVLRFQDVTGADDDLFASFPLELYEIIEEDLVPILEEEPKPKNPWQRIDAEFGESIFQMIDGLSRKSKSKSKKGNRKRRR